METKTSSTREEQQRTTTRLYVQLMALIALAPDGTPLRDQLRKAASEVDDIVERDLPRPGELSVDAWLAEIERVRAAPHPLLEAWISRLEQACIVAREYAHRRAGGQDASAFEAALAELLRVPTGAAPFTVESGAAVPETTRSDSNDEPESVTTERNSTYREPARVSDPGPAVVPRARASTTSATGAPSIWGRLFGDRGALVILACALIGTAAGNLGWWGVVAGCLLTIVGWAYEKLRPQGSAPPLAEPAPARAAPKLRVAGEADEREGVERALRRDVGEHTLEVEADDRRQRTR